jgi:GH24 family phage-related lysozyme (muramidase)
VIDPHLTADIDLAEGCKLMAYKDTEGLWTIGRGHLLGNECDWSGHSITQFAADAQCGIDIQSAQSFASLLPEWLKLDTQCRKNALTELCFNMRGKWRTFVNTRAAMLIQNWQGVHDGLLDSLWASQVGWTRSSRIANYLLTGAYP